MVRLAELIDLPQSGQGWSPEFRESGRTIRHERIVSFGDESIGMQDSLAAAVVPRLLVMARESLVRCRVSNEVKELLQTVAAQKQITESALVRQLIEATVQMATVPKVMDDVAPTSVARDARLYIRLAPEDRILLSGRATARGMPSATYVSVLVRSHLRALAPLPKEELLALKRSVAELGAIGRNLNQIARAANQGGRRGPQGNASRGGGASRPRKGPAKG
jgi:predicted DNA binding CopG/RHH family protein